MAIKVYKAITNGRRNMTSLDLQKLQLTNQKSHY